MTPGVSGQGQCDASLTSYLVPHIDCVLRRAGEEHRGVVRVPGDGVDGRGVASVGHQELGGELRGGQVDVSLLSANQENILVVRLKGYCTGPLHQMISQIISKGKFFRVLENKFVRVP